MKRYLIIASILVLTVFTSCKKYLDVKPYGKVVPKTTQEFEAIIHNILNNMDYGNSDMLIGNFSSVLEEAAFADNLDVNIWGMGKSLPTYVGSRLNLMMTDYTKFYACIKDMNIVIENIKTETDKDKEVLATAYAIRGLCYYNLIREFSPAYDKLNAEKQLGVPLVTKFDIEERPLRSSLRESVELIEDDLVKSISFNLTNPTYRFTVDVTKFLLARLYFWSENWNMLTPLAEELVSKYPLLGESKYEEMMNSVNEIAGNILLKSFVFTDGSSYLSYIGTNKIKVTRPVSVEFIRLFEENERDIRYELSFNNKREVVKVLNGRIRAAEIYFMLAEAYIHNGKPQKALDIINKIRDNRIENNVHFTMETLPKVDPHYLIKVDCENKPLIPIMYTLLTERQKEFFMEGDRWWELKRNGCPEFWVALQNGLKYTTKKFMYTAPINREDVGLVKGLKQNEGYEEL